MALSVATPLALADDRVRSMQEELRRRNVYFGDIDGARSGELEAAVRTYQRRKGFKPSGREDPDTLRSLGLAAPSPGDPPPQELAWPEEPVLRSDMALDPEQEQAEIAAERQADAAPDEISDRPQAAADSEPPRLAAKPHKARKGRGSAAATPRAGVLMLSEPELRDFVQDYLKSASTGIFRSRTLDDEMPYFADRVDYFEHGPVNRVVIERALQKYYNRWPSRRYSLVGQASYRALPKTGQVSVKFRVRFEIKNGARRVSGHTDNTWVIEADTVDPRIVSMKERRVRQQ